jgi:hypothetical protein
LKVIYQDIEIGIEGKCVNYSIVVNKEYLIKNLHAQPQPVFLHTLLKLIEEIGKRKYISDELAFIQYELFCF